MAAQRTMELAEDQKIRREHKFFFDILTALVFILCLLIVGKLVFKDDVGYDSNVYLNVIAVLTTILVLDRRADWRAEKELKERLVMQARSQSNETAKSAVDELRYCGWLEGEDGLLKGADLTRGKLQNSDLHSANLQGTCFYMANLSETNLRAADLRNATFELAELQSAVFSGADLQGVSFAAAHLRKADLAFTNAQNTKFQQAGLPDADLQQSNFQGASFGLANLQGANLYAANLRLANLNLANLQGANLWEANLRDIELHGTLFDGQTTLPDRKPWTPDTDMKRFTDPQHPQFWRSDKS